MKVRRVSVPVQKPYARDIKNVSPKDENGEVRLLTRNEEQELARRIAKGGKDGLLARNQLIEANLRVIQRAVNKALVPFRFLRDEGLIDDNFVDDLIQDANLALLESAEDFNPKYKFSTFVYSVVWKRVKGAIDDRVSNIRLPRYLWERWRKIEEATTQMTKPSGELPKRETVADRTELTDEQIKKVFCARRLVRTQSIEAEVGEEEDSDFASFIADSKALEPLEIVVEKEMKRHVRRYLRSLPGGRQSQREAVHLQYRLDGDLGDGRVNGGYKKQNDLRPPAEIAEIMGLKSRQSAAQYADRGMEKLRNPVSPRMLATQRFLFDNYLRAV